MGRIVVETANDRRITREYDDEGRLLRILVEPVTRGATPDLPKAERQAPPPRPRGAPRVPASSSDVPPAVPRAEELPVVLAEMKDVEEHPVAPAAIEAHVQPTKKFAILATERIEAPVVPAPTLEDTLDRANETLRTPQPPADAAPPPIPPTPPAHVPLDVPDLEARVDALFADRQRSTKAKKRAPLPVPQFEPLRREAWEERLEKVLRTNR